MIIIQCAIYVSSLAFLAAMCGAQELVAGVSILNSQNEVNQLATYRFTLIPEESTFSAGTTIQTTFPSDIQLNLNAQGEPSICQRYLSQTASTSDLSCTYDSDKAMLQFTLNQETDYSIAFEYQIGSFKNPPSARVVRGFKIVILDANQQVLYETVMDSGGVTIYPGPITDQSLKVSSDKVAELSTYTFKFQITNNLPANSRVQVSFPPQGEISVPSGLDSSHTKIKVYDQPWQTGQITTQSSSIIFNDIIDSALVTDTSKFIQVEIKNIQNPKSLTETTSFTVYTMNNENQQIDKASSLMTVKLSIPGDITVSSITPQSDSRVGQLTSINFNILLPYKYDNGGYLEIKFPSEVDLSNLVCYPYIGFVSQSSDCSIKSDSPQTVVLRNDISDRRLYFLISTAKNPPSTKPTSSFQLQAFDSSGGLMSNIKNGAIYTADSGTFSDASVTRTQTEIAATIDNKVTFAFTTLNPLKDQEVIFVRVPYEQLLVDTNNFKCQVKVSGQGVSDGCSLNTDSSDSFSFSVVPPCSSGCPAKSQITLDIEGIQNPLWKVLSLTNSVKIYTMTSDQAFTIDRKVSSFFISPELTEGPLSEMSMSKSLGVVGALTEYDVAFKLANDMPDKGVIRIIFPKNSVYKPNSGSVECLDLHDNSSPLTCSSSNHAIDSEGIQYIEISNLCPSSCPADQKVSIKLRNIKNPGSTKPISNSFTVRTFTQEGHSIDSGIITDATGLDLTPAEFSQVQLGNPSAPIVTGALSTYTILVTPKNGIQQAQGKLEVKFPTEIVLSSESSSCSAKANSYNLDCHVETQDKKIVITNPNSQSFAGSEITINSHNVAHNPITTKPSSKFVIESFLKDSSSQTFYDVYYDDSTLSVTPDTPNKLVNIEVVRTKVEINMKADFIITFETTNPVPSGSSVLVECPKDQVLFQQPLNAQVYDQETDASITKISETDSGQDYTLLELEEWCSQDGEECPANTKLSFRISNTQNPETTKPPSLSFKITIKTSGGYLTDQKLHDIFTSPMLSAGQFLQVKFSESSTMVGDTSTLTVDIELNNEVSDTEGSLQIHLPEKLYYMQEDGDIKCKTEGQQIDCTSKTEELPLGKGISQLNIDLQCSVFSCTSGATRTVSVENLRNRLNGAEYTEQLNIQSLHDEGYTMDASVIEFSNGGLEIQLQPNTNALVQQTTRSPLTVNSATKITVNFQISTRLLDGSLVQAYIPKDAFILPASFQVKCVNLADTEPFTCSLESSSLDQTHHTIQFKELCEGTSPCLDNQEFSVEIEGFHNRYSTLATSTSVKVATFTSDLHAIDQSANTALPQGDLLPSSLQVLSYDLTDTRVGANTTLELVVRAENSIKEGDFISAYFSESIQLFTGEEKCRIVVDEQVLETTCSLEQTNGEVNSIDVAAPQDIEEGKDIKLQIQNIMNLLEDRPLNSGINMKAYTSPDALIAVGSMTLAESDLLDPNDFAELTVNRDDSFELSKQTDLSIVMKSPIPILQESKLLVSVPKTQQAKRDTISCQIDGASIGCSLKSESKDFYEIITDFAVCSSAQCDQLTPITLTIKGFENPLIVTPDVKSFKIVLISKESYNILDTKDQEILAMPLLKVGELKDILVKQTGSLSTGVGTKYLFRFKLPQALNGDNKIVIKFPEQTILKETTNAWPLCKQSSPSKAYSCSFITNGDYITKVTIDDFCQVSTCDEDTLQSIEVFNIRNVEFQRPRDKKLKVQAVTSYMFLLNEADFQESKLPSFEARQIETMKVSRNSEELDYIAVEYIISFKTPNRVGDGSTLYFSIPYEQAIVKHPRSIKCFNAENNGLLECQKEAETADFVIFKVTEWCSGDCQAGQTLSIKLRDMRNPHSLRANAPSNSFELAVLNPDGYLIEQVTEGVVAKPLLRGMLLKDVLVSRQNNLVGSPDFMMFVIPLPSQIREEASVELAIPQSLAFEVPSDEFNCQILLSEVWETRECSYSYNEEAKLHGLLSIKHITIPDVCSSNRICNQNIIVKSKMRNSFSQFEDQTQPFVVTIKGQKVDLGLGSVPNELQKLIANEIKATFDQAKDKQLECYKTGDICAYEINIQTSNPVPSQSTLVVQIPKQMKITSTRCDASLFGTPISCRVNNNLQMTISHSLSNIDPKKLSYSFKVSVPHLQNPFSTKSTDPLVVYSQIQRESTFYRIDELKDQVTLSVTGLSPFQPAAVTRKHDDLGRRVQLTFTLRTRNLIPKSGEMLVNIPETQGAIKTNTLISCFEGPTISLDNPIQCFIVNSTAIRITGICAQSNGCNPGTTKVFSIAESMIINPPYLKDPFDPNADSLSVTSYYEEGDKTFFIDQTNKNLFPTPPLDIGGLTVSNMSLTGFNTSQIVNMAFKAQADSGEFSRDYLRVRFDSPIVNYDPYHEIKVTVNEEASQIYKAQTQLRKALDYVIFECNSNCKGMSQLDIKIENLQNPYFVSDGSYSKAEYKLLLQELYQTPDLVVRQGAYDLRNSILKQMKLSPITKPQILISDPRPTNESVFDIQFSLLYNPQIPKEAIFELTFPRGFTVSNALVCSSIFTSKEYDCYFDTDKSMVVIKNYFEPQINTAVAVKIAGFYNPSQELEGVVQVKIHEADRVYASDNQQLMFKIERLSTDCQNNCQLCNQEGTCYECQKPSEAPLISKGQCVTMCPDEQFEHNGKCYRCTNNCQQCHTFDQCSGCDGALSFIDGRCILTNKCPAGTDLNSHNECTTDQECVSNCATCGLDKNYCSTCNNGMQSLNGRCIQECPSQFYESDGKCLKCNSLCGECSSLSDRCTQCRDDLFQQQILDLGIDMCVSECSKFGVPRASDKQYCDPCGTRCYTCSGQADNCTGCYFDKLTKEDLFYFDNKCLTTCPIGFENNYDTHICEDFSLEVAAFPPIYLITSAGATIVALTASKVLSGRTDVTSDAALSLTTQLEFLNRMFLLFNLWTSTKTFSFCLTGMNILTNSFIGIYFATLIIAPISNQLKSNNTKSLLFKSIVALSQISGVNSIRLLTSNFMGISSLSNKFSNINYYVTQLELISLLSTATNVIQLFTGVSCLLDFSFGKDSFGLGMNAIVFNTGLVGMQVFKYFKARAMMKSYSAVARI